MRPTGVGKENGCPMWTAAIKSFRVTLHVQSGFMSKSRGSLPIRSAFITVGSYQLAYHPSPCDYEAGQHNAVHAHDDLKDSETAWHVMVSTPDRFRVVAKW